VQLPLGSVVDRAVESLAPLLGDGR
jgi:hypothetical protein